MEFIQNYLNVSIVIVCVIVGYLWKNTTPLANKYIPLVVTILGTILACVVSQGINIDIICIGMISGLASTGLHQLVTKILDQLAQKAE